MQETEFQCLLRGLLVVCLPGLTEAPALAGGPDSKAAFYANRKLDMALEKRKLRLLWNWRCRGSQEDKGAA